MVDEAVPRKTRPLLPGEDADTTSAATARRWLAIYELRESLLGSARHDAIDAEAATGVAAGAAYWRVRAVELSGLDLDTDRRLLRIGPDTEIALTRREVELLEFLAGHPGRPFPDHVLAVRAWGERLSGDQVRIYVRRLREKLNGTGWQLTSRRGYGYQLQRDSVGPMTAAAQARVGVNREMVDHAVGRARGLLVQQQEQLQRTSRVLEQLRNLSNGHGAPGI